MPNSVHLAPTGSGQQKKAKWGTREPKSGNEKGKGEKPSNERLLSAEKLSDLVVKKKIAMTNATGKRKKEKAEKEKVVPEPPKKSLRRRVLSKEKPSSSLQAPSDNKSDIVEVVSNDEKSMDKKRSIEPSKEDGSKVEAKIEVKKKKKKEKETKPAKNVKPPPVPIEDKFNMQLAQKFFKQMLESKKSSKQTFSSDLGMETMPEPSDIRMSLKAAKKNRKKHAKTSRKPLDRNIFKPNGEPVWVVHDSSTEVITEDGVKTRYPELLAALEEDNLEMDDTKQWCRMVNGFLDGLYTTGMIKEVPEFDPYAPYDEIMERSEMLNRKESVIYYTMCNLLCLCKAAMDRFDLHKDENPREKWMRIQEERLRAMKREEEEERTAIVTSIRFNMEGTFSISYDRRRPIMSIQKFRKKYQNRLRVSAEKCSRENGK
ncbi:unnamed protein product [Caenorhabditis sp. 36 PRJEB53466]|nr:unnamed protein product [Caenorhabditis sp. 36 PRJEB53466]